MDTKHWSASKTIWFNVGTALLTLLCSNIDVLQSVLPDQVYVYVSMAAAGVNVLLRARTSVPITNARS